MVDVAWQYIIWDSTFRSVCPFAYLECESAQAAFKSVCNGLGLHFVSCQMRAALLVFSIFVISVLASSHSEAPGTSKQPNADISDFYMFQCYEPGREDYTCFIVNTIPLQHPYGGPNYYSLSDQHFFEIYVDNDGDAEEDITFQFYFGNSAGGTTTNVPYQEEDPDCDLSTAKSARGAMPKSLFKQAPGGITVPVDGKDVPIALKTAGVITRSDQRGLNWHEWYFINYIEGDRSFGDVSEVTESSSSNTKFTKPFDYSGTKTFPNYEDYASQYEYNIDIPNCGVDGRVFVGQRNDPFYISLGPIFDLVNFIPIPNLPGISVTEDQDHNDLKNTNVASIVLEVPTQCLVKNGERGVIGAWAAVRKLLHKENDHVPGRQVSRLGNPLVNELLVPLLYKNHYSSIEPIEDEGFTDEYIKYPSFPEVLNQVFLDTVNSLGNAYTTIAPTNFPREDLEAVFLTGVSGINQPRNVQPADIMRLNTSIPVTPIATQSAFGVLGGDLAGYPNGRRPGDDTVDITLRAAMGALCWVPGLGFCSESQAVLGNVLFTDGSPVSARDFRDTFPYLNTPVPGSTGI